MQGLEGYWRSLRVTAGAGGLLQGLKGYCGVGGLMPGAGGLLEGGWRVTGGGLEGSYYEHETTGHHQEYRHP